LPLLLFHLLTAVNAVKYDDLRPLIAVGITSSVLLAQHFGCSKRWINQLKREASPVALCVIVATIFATFARNED